MEWANYVAEKNEGTGPPLKDSPFLRFPLLKIPVPRSAFPSPFPFPFPDSPFLVIKIAAVFMYKAAIHRYIILRGMVLEKY